MIWPWSRSAPKVAEFTDTGWTDSIVASLVTSAAGSNIAGTAVRIASVETAARWWSRAASLAIPQPMTAATAALSPTVLSEAAWRLARSGDAVFVIDVDMGGRVELRPVWAWDVQGGDYRPETWRYRCDMAAPDGHRTVVVDADRVLHLRLVTSAAAPWRGVPPWRAAKLTADMAGAIDARLSEEAANPSGYLIGVADTGSDSDGSVDQDQLRTDMGIAAGGTLLTPTHQGGLGAGPAAAPPPARELKPSRFGADPPQTLVQLRTQASREMLGLYGIPPALMDERPSGQTLRESWRILVRLTVGPLMRTIAAQAGPALDVPDLRFDMSEASAGDVATLARAWRSLVGNEAKLDPDQAREVVGL